MKGIKQTTREEALACKNYYKEVKDLDLAAKYLEHLLNLTQDHAQRGELMLELADMYMELDQRSKASKLYNQYKVFYPGSPSIQYVLYQEILANQHETLASNKDQSKTQETLRLAQEFLQEFPDDPTYRKDVRHSIRVCQLKLLKSEVAAAQFYLGKYVYEPRVSVLKAAHNRIEHIFKEYMAQLLKNPIEIQQFDRLKQEIDASSESVYRASLQKVIMALDDYVQKYAEPEESFITKWLPTKRHDKRPQIPRL